MNRIDRNKLNPDKVVGFTAGNFDLLHPGYIYTFEDARKHCDHFIVFLQRDPSETRFSKYKPVIPLYERYRALMAIQYVDEVYIYQTEEELYELIKFFKPDVRILGEDYIGKPCTGDDLPPKIIYTSRAHGWSTTKLKDLITRQTMKQNPDVLNEKVDKNEQKKDDNKNKGQEGNRLPVSGL
jgi:glycerol-3-phosphate cytidylyltransferase